MGKKTASSRIYLLIRALKLAPTILFVMLIGFSFVHLAPGDPTMFYINPEMKYSEEYMKRVRAMLGLDKPLPEQFLIYVRNVFQGNFGYSLIYRQPVINLIIPRGIYTATLIISALLWSLVVGILLGAISAQRRGSLLDSIITSISVSGWSIPYFWYGEMLILFLSLELGLLPVGGVQSARLGLTGIESIIDRLQHLVLPSICLGTSTLGMITRLTRATMIDCLQSDYIVMARSKGLKERIVVYKHALKNALVPVINQFGLNIGRNVAGAILTEIVFAYPGLGSLLYTAVLQRDYSIVVGMFVSVGIIVFFVNFAVDIICALIDPRIKYG